MTVKVSKDFLSSLVKSLTSLNVRTEDSVTIDFKNGYASFSDNYVTFDRALVEVSGAPEVMFVPDGVEKLKKFLSLPVSNNITIDVDSNTGIYVLSSSNIEFKIVPYNIDVSGLSKDTGSFEKFKKEFVEKNFEEISSTPLDENFIKFLKSYRGSEECVVSLDKSSGAPIYIEFDNEGKYIFNEEKLSSQNTVVLTLSKLFYKKQIKERAVLRIYISKKNLDEYLFELEIIFDKGFKGYVYEITQNFSSDFEF